jgi:hypothetical protein
VRSECGTKLLSRTTPYAAGFQCASARRLLVLSFDLLTTRTSTARTG